MKSLKILAIIPVSTATVFISNLYSAADVIGRVAEGSIFGMLRLLLFNNFKASQEAERRHLTELDNQQ